MTPTRIAIVSFLGGAALVAVVFFLFVERVPQSPEDAGVIEDHGLGLPQPDEAPETWVVYENEPFGFSIDRPASWKIAESNEGGTAMITIYKPGSFIVSESGSTGGFVAETPPYTHFSNATHVSIYPVGIPTEGVVGRMRESTITFGPKTDRATDYLSLGSGAEAALVRGVDAAGAPWATYVTFAEPPENWKPWGFVWASVALEGDRTVCYRNGKSIDTKSCDPLSGDDIVHTGTPDPDERAIEVRMLESFRFLD